MKLNKITGIWMCFLLVLPGCISETPSGEPTAIDEILRVDIPKNVAKLPLMKLETVNNFEIYKIFADNMNNLVKILNENNELFDIPFFDVSQKGFEKASKFITEYGPLINNYNEVVNSAKEFEKNSNDNNLKQFYKASGKFGFETALIVGTVFYTVTFKAVGIVYRAVGLNRLALICGPCVSVILGNAHWFIRSVLVEGSSQLAQKILDLVDERV